MVAGRHRRLHVEAGDGHGVDPRVLAGIGSIESDHGRSPAPESTRVAWFGCCAGPMQLSVVVSPSSWDRFDVDGHHDGRASSYDPADVVVARRPLTRGCRADAVIAIQPAADREEKDFFVRSAKEPVVVQRLMDGRVVVQRLMDGRSARSSCSAISAGAAWTRPRGRCSSRAEAGRSTARGSWIAS